jgi:hypothetical protein
MTLKVILFILAMLVWGISVMVKKLQEQAAIKRAREEQARRRLDGLRTGQYEEAPVGSVVVTQGPTGAPAPLSHQEATRRLQDMAERRRLQLDELRRRAAAQGQPIPTTVAPPGPAAPPAARPLRIPSRPQPTRPATRQAMPAPARQAAPPSPRIPRTPPVGRPTGPAPRQSRPAPADVAHVKRTNAEKRRVADETDETQRQARHEAQRAMGREKPVVKQTPAAPVVSPRSGIGQILLPTGRASAAEWRRIMMLREVLALPVALREDGAAR